MCPHQRVEGAGPLAQALFDARLGQQEPQLLTPAKTGPGLLRGSGQPGQRLALRLGGEPMRRHARGHALVPAKVRSDRTVQMSRNRRWHGTLHRVVHQVVGEGLVAQHAGRFELGERAGELDGTQAHHFFGQGDAKVHSGDRRHTGQREGTLRELADAPLDQPFDADRPRQVAAAHPVSAQRLLQRLERKQRVSAGVAHQLSGQLPAVQLGQAQRIDQRGHRHRIQRFERHGAQRAGVLQAVVQHGRGGTAFCWPPRKQPKQPLVAAVPGQR